MRSPAEAGWRLWTRSSPPEDDHHTSRISRNNKTTLSLTSLTYHKSKKRLRKKPGFTAQHSEAHKQETIASNRMAHPSNRDQQAKRPGKPSRPAHAYTAESCGTSQHEPRFAFEEFAKREIENFTSVCHLPKHTGQGPD